MEVGAGGGLFFKAGIDNSELDKAIDETLLRIKGLSSTSEKAGDVMDSVFKDLEVNVKEHGINMADVVTGMRNEIESSFTKIDEAFNASKQGMGELEAEFRRLGDAASEAFMKGDDESYRKLSEKQRMLGSEITVRKKLTKEIGAQADEMRKVEVALDKYGKGVENQANKQLRMTTRIRELKQEMSLLIQQGIEPQAPAYQKLSQEMAELTRIQRDLNAEAKIYAGRQQTFQGVVAGVGGISGAFSAAAGTASLFANESEDLQKILVKLQSVMAVTMGLQQVSTMLNRDSAFQLVVVRKAKEWWTAVTVKSGVAVKAESIALAENAIAQQTNAAATATATATKAGNTIATTAGTAATTTATVANRGLAGSFRLIGTAIKSIPVFGWILAGISALFGLYRILTRDIRNAKKEQNEFFKSIADNVYKPLAAMQELRGEWDSLGDSLEDKQKFVDENAKKFLEYGIAIKSVQDAEKLLSDPGNVQKFVDAQIAKAKSVALMATNADDMKKWAEAYIKLENARANPKLVESQNPYQLRGEKQTIAVQNPAVSKYEKETKELENKMRGRTDLANKYAKESADAIEEINKNIGNTQKSLYETYQKEMDDINKKIQASVDEKEIRELQGKLEVIKKKNDELFRPMEEKIKPDKEPKLTEEEKIAKREQELYERYYKKLLDDYGLYYEKRKKLAAEYENDMAILKAEQQKEQDPDKKAVIEEAISNRVEKYKKDTKAIEDADNESYTKLVAQYRTFEQQKSDIAAQYASERAIAAGKGNETLVEEINKAEVKALQELNVESIITSETWNQLFGNLDNLAVDEMIRLRNLIESQWKELDLTPEQLDALRDKIDKVTEVITQRNPFKALLESLKRYKEGEKGVTFKDLAREASGAIELVGGAWNAVTEGLESMGLAGDDITQKLLGDIGKMVDSAGELAMGIATGNPLQIIQGGIGLLTSAFEVFNAKDRRAERQIRKHAENLEKLEKSYQKLEKAIDKALGTGRYTETQNALKNLEKQQRELAAMQDAERSKKKTDKNKVKEYREAEEAAAERRTEIIEQMRIDLLGLDAKTAAQQLGDAFLNAFKQGEDGLEAFGQKADEIVANIMRQMLIQKLLEEPIGKILDKYSKQWYNDKGEFVGFDSVMGSLGSMGNEIKDVGSAFAKGIEDLPDEIKKYFTGEDGGADVNSMKGAIKGVTEETASLLAGQINAMRIQQVESLNVMRNQLLKLSAIEHNTSYNHFLESIDSKLDAMSNHNDTVRAAGLS